MRRVILSLSVVGLLAACNNKDYYEQDIDPIYFVNKIHEEILPIGGTGTITTDYEFKYRGLGLLENQNITISAPFISTQQLAYETSYDGSFPRTTLYKVGGTTVSTTTYDQYVDRGSIMKKTTTEVGRENFPTVEEYEYYNRNTLSKYTSEVKTTTNTSVHTEKEYIWMGSNELNVKTSVYTQTGGSISSPTVITTDKYIINYNETVKEHTHTENGQTVTISYTYDNKTNPRYLQFSHRMTHPEFFLQEGYNRNNITKKTVKYSHVSGQDYEEETAYEYFKNEYPLKAIIKRNGTVVGSKEFTYIK